MEISTVGQCVLELILNALDAKTTGVAVRFHSEKKRIQVIDSGEGIPPDVLLRIGEAEKNNGNDLKILCYSNATEGKSLKQILDLSQICIITSKHERSSETYEKVFKIGESPVFFCKNCLDKGTAITICGFQGSGWDSALISIYYAITSLALIYTDVSFTLQDQKTEKLAIGISKPHEPYSILNIICRETISLKTSWYLNSMNFSGFKICGYVGYLETKSILVRNIFVNRRPANCLQIQKLILETMKNLCDEFKISSSENIYFILFIQCPSSDFILSSYEGSTFVIFQNWDEFANVVKSSLSNTIRINYNSFMEPGSSAVQESFKPNESYENAERVYLEKRNDRLVRNLNKENCLDIYNRPLEEKVSRATQTSISLKNQELNLNKPSKNKIAKTKPSFMFYDHKQNRNNEIEAKKAFVKKGTHIKTKAKSMLKNNCEETSRNQLKGKKTKVKQFPIPKKNVKDIFNRQICKSFTLNKQMIDRKAEQEQIPKKDQKEHVKKSIQVQKLKVKKNQIFKRNENMFKKPLGSHRITMTQLSFHKKRNRDGNSRERSKKLNEVVKKIVPKQNYEDMVKKYLRKQRAQAKEDSDLKIWHEEKMVDSEKIKKLNDCKTIIKRLRKRKKICFDEGIDFLNKDRSERKRNNHSHVEKTGQKNQQELNLKDKNEKMQSYEKKEYNIIEKMVHQRMQEETNQLNLQANKPIRIFDENRAEFFDINQYSNVEENRDLNNQEKVTDSREDVENQFVAGEKNLELIHFDNSLPKIHPEHYSQLSEWSDWNYDWPISKDTFQVPESKKVEHRRLYYFLPPILNSMLRFGKTNILSEANIQNNIENVSTIFNPEIKSDQILSRYQNLNVRLCVDPHPNEFKLNRKTLYSIQILRQINLEFIAAIAVQDNSKLLLMIDQHAADERIRYENLLQNYRIDSTKQYYSISLDHPILISDMESQKRKILLSNEKLLNKFGIQLKFSSSGCLMVTNVPRCFLRKKSVYSDFKLTSSINNLLSEIIESLESTNGASILPKSIHNAIASEACRGAIKFGDLLSKDQCHLLIKSLRKTNAPNRCAHGRPSIVPLLDVTDLKKKQIKPFQKKLNFGSLMKKR